MGRPVNSLLAAWQEDRVKICESDFAGQTIRTKWPEVETV